MCSSGILVWFLHLDSKQPGKETTQPMQEIQPCLVIIDPFLLSKVRIFGKDYWDVLAKKLGSLMNPSLNLLSPIYMWVAGFFHWMTNHKSYLLDRDIPSKERRTTWQHVFFFSNPLSLKKPRVSTCFVQWQPCYTSNQDNDLIGPQLPLTMQLIYHSLHLDLHLRELGKTMNLRMEQRKSSSALI